MLKLFGLVLWLTTLPNLRNSFSNFAIAFFAEVLFLTALMNCDGLSHAIS